MTNHNNSSEVNLEDQPIDELFRWVLHSRDDMGELLGNIAHRIYTNPDCLQEFKILELGRLYQFMEGFHHWSANAHVFTMAASWITVRLMEIQEELDMDLGIKRLSKEQIEFRKQGFREICGLNDE